MQIIKVSYERIFPLAPYVNEKIGFEATIDGSAESEKDALNKLKQIAEEWHKVNCPHLYESNGQPIISENTTPAAVITVDRTSEDERIAKLIANIYACTETGGEDGLGSYWTLAQGNDEAKQAYNIMRKKLVKIEKEELIEKRKQRNEGIKQPE